MLKASDFIYQGAISLYGGVLGQGTEGLAYRKSSNTWFTLAKAGQPPYELFEVSLPAPNLTGTPLKAAIVKDWGPLNINGALDVKGSLVGMKGLFWDDKENKLWFTFGSFYANNADNNVIGYATLDTGKPVIHGPWKVTVHSDLAKGMIIEAPPEMQAITNQRFLMFGVRGSTNQQQSWGVGLVSVAEPDNNAAAGAVLPSEKLIHWPMQVKAVSSGDVHGLSSSSGFKELPGDMYTQIVGNEDTGKIVTGTAQRGTATTITLDSASNYSPTSSGIASLQTLVGWYVTNMATGEQLPITGWDNATKIATVAGGWNKSIPVSGTSYQIYYPSYQHNIVMPPTNAYGPVSFVDQAVWIDLPTKHGLVYFGGAPIGYQWYGNPASHSDSTPTGATYKNNFESLLLPGQPIQNDSQNRGNHAEEHVLRWYVVDPDAVVNVAQKVMNGTATANDLQIPWSNAGDLKTLGGAVQFGNPNILSLGESYWDAKDGLLYLLTPQGGTNGDGIIEVWKVQ